MKKIFSIFICLFLSISGIAQTTVTLKGKVVGRDSKEIIIFPRTSSSRSTAIVTIPILNNQFEYTFTAKNLEGYEMAFGEEFNKSVWEPIVVFPDTSVIELVLNDKVHHLDNIIIGGKINKSYYDFMELERTRYKDKKAELNKVRDGLRAAENYQSEVYITLMADLAKVKTAPEALPFYLKQAELQKTGRDLTPEALHLKTRYDSLERSIYKWRYAYFKQNPSLGTYFLMFLDTRYRAKENRYLTMLIDETYRTYAVKFPGHIYTKEVGDIIGSIVKIFPGNQFVDFTAPDLKGQQFTLSEQIKGKVALIDLWGSWCGPCIAKAKLVVPIYKKYKSKGFTVVGVAREFKNTEALKDRLKREEFSWINLVELDDKHGIWTKYSISDGSGIQILVDSTGKILAVDPTAEELERIVKSLIKG